MRTFIAIELPKEIKDKLALLQEQLKASNADVKWVEPKNIHLTLKFIGERDDKKVEKIMQILDEVAQNKNTYEASIYSLGAFPSINSPRVIWVGLQQGDNETKAIAQDLEEKIAKIGIPKEDRPFASHITIGRTRSGLNKEKLFEAINKLAVNLEKEFQNFAVGKIVLFKSTLTPKGPLYEALKVANLRKT